MQRLVTHLVRRHLVAPRTPGRTQGPFYRLLQPWRR
jgi:hypothetical protein